VENFLYEKDISRGNDKKHGPEGPQANGMPRVINTIFTILRIAFYLGFRRAYLLGCDFEMSPNQPYSFNQQKWGNAANSNNGTYQQLTYCLDQLKVQFDKASFKVYNCNPASKLWTFDFIDFEQAVAQATRHFTEELDCNGWYEPEPGMA
jgi:hypothetical protein